VWSTGHSFSGAGTTAAGFDYRVASKAATQIEGDGYWIVHQLRVVTIRGFGHQ
jgi:hypothetical protein